jgi:hypothetical protein
MLFIQFLILFFNSFFYQPNTSKNVEGGLCGQPNFSYGVGEKITYTLFYNVIGIYVNAGRADFSITQSDFNGVDTYTFTALGKSNAKYDWIFKVRDKYESIVDVKTLLPYQFTRQINEGGFHQKDLIQFNQKAKTATTGKVTYTTADCTYDVISAIYAARNISYANLQINEKIYLNFFLDKDLYPSYFKYLGRETVTTQYGTFKAIKLAPLLLKGTIFKGGEKMVIWISDDSNHIPVRIETPILVGALKVDLVGYENLRHPLNSLQSLVE